MMTLPVKGGRITAYFDDPRPLSNPGAHIHGALDIAGGDGLIRSPCSGTVQGFAFFRQRSGGWAVDGEKEEILHLPWRGYWADTFGAVLALTEDGTGLLHLFAHVWPGQLNQVFFSALRYVESADPGRWPAHFIATERKAVRPGTIMAKMGNAGYSTGPHVHWEIHHSANLLVLDDYDMRANPANYIHTGSEE